RRTGPGSWSSSRTLLPQPAANRSRNRGRLLGLRQECLVQPAGVLNRQWADAPAVAEHFFLQSRQLDRFARRQRAGVLAVDQSAAADVRGFHLTSELTGQKRRILFTMCCVRRKSCPFVK